MQLKCFIIIIFVIFICPILTTTYRASCALNSNKHNCFSDMNIDAITLIMWIHFTTMWMYIR